MKGTNTDDDSFDEEMPLLRAREQAVLQEILHEEDVTLNLNGDVKVGSYRVNHRGVVQADARSFYDEEKKQEVPFKWFFTLMFIAFILAELSGASGYEGGENALAPPAMLRGTPAGLGSWESNSVLNGIGTWEFMKWLLIQLSRGTGFNGSMLMAIFVGFMAALTPGILAGRGADMLFYGKDSVTHMTPKTWAVGAFFGSVNLVVSGALNVTSLLKLASALKNYYRRITTCCTGDDKRVWRNQCIEAIAKLTCTIALFPVLYAALLATIARGRSTYDFVAGFTGDAIAYEVFGFTAAPGFAMFLGSFLKLVLFIEGIIKFTLTKLVYRSSASFSGIDIFINLLATSIAGTCAMFVYYNYDGLSASAYKDDWGLGKVVMQVVTSLEAFLIPASSAAAANLVMRVPDIASYLAGISDYARYKYTNPVEREAQGAKAQRIWDAYKLAHPDKEAEFAQLIETYFKRRPQMTHRVSNMSLTPLGSPAKTLAP